MKRYISLASCTFLALALLTLPNLSAQDTVYFGLTDMEVQAVYY